MKQGENGCEVGKLGSRGVPTHILNNKRIMDVWPGMYSLVPRPHFLSPDKMGVWLLDATFLSRNPF